MIDHLRWMQQHLVLMKEIEMLAAMHLAGQCSAALKLIPRLSVVTRRSVVIRLLPVLLALLLGPASA